MLSKIAALMPSERVVKFTRVTENSFYNYDEFFFKNKLICLEDIDGLKEEALFAWRELISNNRLSSSTSQKDENGNIRSAQRIVRRITSYNVCYTKLLRPLLPFLFLHQSARQLSVFDNPLFLWSARCFHPPQ